MSSIMPQRVSSYEELLGLTSDLPPSHFPSASCAPSYLPSPSVAHFSLRAPPVPRDSLMPLGRGFGGRVTDSVPPPSIRAYRSVRPHSLHPVVARRDGGA